MIDPLQAAEWVVGAIIALAVAIAALRWLKLSPIWALVIGMAVFAGLTFPIQTHAIKLDMPRAKSN